MQYEEFVGKVHQLARVGTTGEAVRAIQATFQTLARRLHGNEAQDLAAQLPQALGAFLQHGEPSEAFGLEAFYERVQEIEGIDFPDAVFHARVVMQVLNEAVSQGQMDDVRAQLPPEYEELFERVTE